MVTLLMPGLAPEQGFILHSELSLTVLKVSWILATIFFMQSASHSVNFLNEFCNIWKVFIDCVFSPLFLVSITNSTYMKIEDNNYIL